MIIKQFQDKTPKLTGAYLAEDVSVIGDVTVEENASIWYGAVLRGDVDRIFIGANTSVQDNSVVHCSTGMPTVIGKNCVVGHNAILHSCTVEDRLPDRHGGSAAGRLPDRPGQYCGGGSCGLSGEGDSANSMVMGVPGRVTRQLTDKDQEATAWSV